MPRGGTLRWTRTPYDSEYATCERTAARVRVYGEGLEPNAVSVALGIQPSKSQRMGDKVATSPGRKRVAKTGLWLLSSEEHVESRDLRDHLDWLLGVLVPKAEELHTILEPMEAVEADISCIWWSKYGQGGPVLWPEHLDGLARVGLELGLDISFFGDDE